jgi:hypothetical protein
MTILHANVNDDDDDDNENNSIFACQTSTNQRKAIPQWARSTLNTIRIERAMIGLANARFDRVDSMVSLIH